MRRPWWSIAAPRDGDAGTVLDNAERLASASVMEGAAPEGQWNPGWDGVAQAFSHNFGARGEVGANLCVIHRGETVVDIAGGRFDDRSGRSFERDAMVPVFSTTKGMTAACIHLLADRGELCLDAPISKYWSAFGAGGKGGVTVAMLLDHSAGVPAFREALQPAAYLDAEYMADRIAAEAPFWEPGTRCGYHALTFGWAAGELVRRISGQTLGHFFRNELATPSDADFWIGLPDAEEARTAPLIAAPLDPGAPTIEVLSNIVSNPNSVSALAFVNDGGFSQAALSPGSGSGINGQEMHKAENGSAGGIGSARGIARLYAAMGNGALSRDQMLRMSRTSMASHRDAILLIPVRFAAGFMKSIDNRKIPLGDICSFIIGESAFGHVGAGGSFGFYDPDADVAVGYAMRRMGRGILLDVCGQALVDAVYQALGFRTNHVGAWVR